MNLNLNPSFQDPHLSTQTAVRKLTQEVKTLTHQVNLIQYKLGVLKEASPTSMTKEMRITHIQQLQTALIAKKGQLLTAMKELQASLISHSPILPGSGLAAKKSQPYLLMAAADLKGEQLQKNLQPSFIKSLVHSFKSALEKIFNPLSQKPSLTQLDKSNSSQTTFSDSTKASQQIMIEKFNRKRAELIQEGYTMPPALSKESSLKEIKQTINQARQLIEKHKAQLTRSEIKSSQEQTTNISTNPPQEPSSTFSNLKTLEQIKQEQEQRLQQPRYQAIININKQYRELASNTVSIRLLNLNASWADIEKAEKQIAILKNQNNKSDSAA